jgi:diacylglycerol kinase family enzyme
MARYAVMARPEDIPWSDPPSLERPRLSRIEAVINPASGGVGPGAAAKLAQLVSDKGYQLNVSIPAPGELETEVRKAIDGDPDLVVILAGDGTARFAAEIAGGEGPLLAPLPGGTLNMLPHALYGNHAWPEALTAALDHGVERHVAGGRLGGHAFYVAAILGSPALWGYAREAARKGNLHEAWRRARFALRRAFSGKIQYALDGRVRREAEALVLINPIVSKAMVEERALEVAAMEIHSAQEVFRLAFTGLISDWRRDPGVIVEESLFGQAWARHAIPCILDGEIQRLPRGVRFEFQPRAFRALAPPAKGARA